MKSELNFASEIMIGFNGLARQLLASGLLSLLSNFTEVLPHWLSDAIQAVWLGPELCLFLYRKVGAFVELCPLLSQGVKS